MLHDLVLWLACAIIFMGLDFLWIGVFALKLYQREIGPLMLGRPKLAPAIILYPAYVLVMVLLVAAPAAGDVVKAGWMGALLGFAACGTYDLTNLALLKGFTRKLAIIDIAWAMVVGAIAAGGGVWIGSFVP
jgi:uncharacterized membrane protein